MSSGSEDEDRSPVASRRAVAAADRLRRGKAKRNRGSPSYLSLRDRDRDRDEIGRRSRSPSPSRRRGRRYFDDQVERRSPSPIRRRRQSRSPSSSGIRRRRARSDSDEDVPDRRGRSLSPRRGPAPRSCRSRSRTRSEECEDRLCCRRRRSTTTSPGDGERSVSPSPPPEQDFYLRIDRPDDLFKCAHCFQLLSSPVYECVDGHVTCAVCHGSTNEGDAIAEGDGRCARCGSTEYRQSRAVAGWLESVLFPCGNHEHGCPAFLPRREVEAHERSSCRYAPVFCPADWRCAFPGGPTDALERHVTAVHDWTVAGARYGQPVLVRARPGPSRSLLRAEEDGALFYLCARAADGGRSAALSMIHIRPDDAPAAAAAAGFTYEVRTPAAAAPGLQHRIQMQSVVWGTSLRDGVLYANPVSVKVPASMLPREGPEQDSVEVRIVKVPPPAAVGDRDVSSHVT